jgi:AraC family transcriptional regulator
MIDKSEYIPNIRNAIDYIEMNIKKRLSLVEIASVAYYSEYHFHRVFTLITGFTVNEYIRKRRISEAAKELVICDKKIRDISYQYGFSNQESFTRAFQDYFKITPSEYRRFGVLVSIVEKLELTDKFNQFAGCEIQGPQIVSLPVRYYIGRMYSGNNNNDDIFSFTHSFLQMKNEIKNCTGENYYTFDTYRFDKYRNRIYDFFATMPVTSLKEVPEGMIGIEIAKTDYALIKYKGNGEYLYAGENQNSVYSYIYEKLLPENGIHFRDGEYKLQHENSYRAVESDFVNIIIPVSI